MVEIVYHFWKHFSFFFYLTLENSSKMSLPSNFKKKKK